jgi:hypothetical protein
MANIKYEYAEHLHQITNHFLNDIKEKGMPLEDAYLYFMGATEDDVKTCLLKISHALPDNFFIQPSKLIDEEIKDEIVSEYVLFMAQEDVAAQNFGDHFANFIYSTINEVAHNHHLWR